jgi:hypothetical protein
MLHWDIKVWDLEVLYFVVKELIDKENYNLFIFHLKYYFQPLMNHVNSWKPHIPVQKWWNLATIGRHLQIDPFIKRSGELYLQDHRHVYVFCMFLVSSP